MPEPKNEPLKELLKSRFGLDDFRPGQRPVLESVLARKDAIAVMPTGGGKSLCYQLPAVYFKGLVIVISPLISLMKDQVENLTKIGIEAGAIYSGQGVKEKREIFSRLKNSENFILYLSPERVQKEGFAQWIKTKKVSLFAIDEAHCVSQWGPDFRKDYHRLRILRHLRPEVPILALTATATPEVLFDIARVLQLKSPDRHVYGFYRHNLFIQVAPCSGDGEKLEYITQALRQNPEGRVIIYCGTRNQTEDLSETLMTHFKGVDFYHAGMSAKDRARIQEQFSDGSLRILVATNAFGMGIDHGDVRLVIHYQIPANVESFYQEIGRAGRDGNPSTCLLLYAKKDKGLHAYFIGFSRADKSVINRKWRALDSIVSFSEGGECRHAGILTYFKDTQRIKSCGHCDTCDPFSELMIEPPAARLKAVKRPGAKRSKKSLNLDAPLSGEAELRAEILREWRKNYAEENDLPAFVVFSNRTLADLALKNPKTLSDLQKIYGFGPQKIEHLGPRVLEQLRVISSQK